MQRRVLLGTGAAVLVVAVYLALRNTTRHEAGHAVDQGIDQMLARLPPGYAVRHGTTDYNGLTSALTVRDVVVTRDGATLWTAERVTVAGADGQALQDVFDPAAYPDGRPKWTDRRLLVADAAAENIHAIAGPGRPEVTIRHASLHRLSGRPFMLPPTPENRMKPQFGADAALALAVDSARESEATMKVETPVARPAGQAMAGGAQAMNTVSVGAYELSDYDGGKVGSLAFKDMVFDRTTPAKGAEVHISLASAEMKNADLRKPLQTLRETGHISQGGWGTTGAGAFGLGEMAIDVASGPHVGLAEFHGTQKIEAAGGSVGTTVLHGFTMALGQTPLPAAAAPAIAAFGAKAITMDMEGSSRSAAGGGMMLHEDIVLRDLGTLHLDGSFADYDAALASPAKPMASLQAMTLQKAALVFDDNSLTNRVLAVAATQLHATPDLVRAQLAMPIVTLGLLMPQQPDVADQVTNFLNHPHTLTLTMNPPQKVTLGEIGRAPAPSRAQMLGLHISSK